MKKPSRIVWRLLKEYQDRLSPVLSTTILVPGNTQNLTNRSETLQRASYEAIVWRWVFLESLSLMLFENLFKNLTKDKTLILADFSGRTFQIRIFNTRLI